MENNVNDDPLDYDDEVTEEDIKALEAHVEKHFGKFDKENADYVSEPAW